MQRDFSIWQRASDVWQEAHQSALEQRLARRAEQGIYAEAALTIGAILGALSDVRRIHFTMVRGSRVLARGDSSRGRP